MAKRAIRAAVLVAALALVAPSTGCGGGTSGAAPQGASGPPTSSGASSPSSPTSSSTVPPAFKENCLFSISTVSSVLEGNWKREPSFDTCVYTSSRGGEFVTALVPIALSDGLALAAKSCLPGIAPIRLGQGSTVCVRESRGKRAVVGTLGSEGQLFSVVIFVPKTGVPEPQLKAMVELVQAALA